MIKFEVGKPFPYGPPPVDDGMIAMISPAEDALSVMLACHIANPSPGEVERFREKPMRLGVWASWPLTWILADNGELAFDAPYVAALERPQYSGDIRAIAATIAKAPDSPLKLLLTIALIDRGTTRALRAVSVSHAWMKALAGGIVASPLTLAPGAFDMAVVRDTALSTPEMFAKAAIVEVGGRM